MKNSAGRGECYPPRPKAEVDNTLRDLQNSSYPTKAEFNNLQRTALLTSLVQYDRILGQQQLFMVNYACGFN